ncbi:substrate-binding periplasmic protein [Maridesulfovibrio salexigens]|uniref:Extracellular solute-binding protein family 3 n=1 Tax=Maridesulfovibrio salexigens (strain ATCC 14822 / DSM 2638 / NCIMB 8403 / VKM B-1763) TaxID=526222 RepID=C6BW63_MARSD|nr:transporter substrate-binding domain-containing protein [Maridesulfovibrio salexigens]ACS78307.1 extracellular solute-binding protein family 3 [Maridesulfovibrio salexigens DSM 2638]
MNRIRVVSVVLLALIMLTYGRAVSAVEVVTVATGEWEPYVSKSNGGSGICTDIVKAAFAAEGIKVEFQFYPWKRALRCLMQAGVDGSFPWVKRDEREKLFLYSDPIYEMKASLFYLKKRFKDHADISSDVIKKYLVGVPLGYELGNDLKQMGYKCEPVPCISNGFEMLLKGRIDFLLESDDVGRYLIKESYSGLISEFGEIAAPLKSESLHLLLCKKRNNSKYLLRMFNKGLKKIKSSGKYAKLIEKY